MSESQRAHPEDSSAIIAGEILDEQDHALIEAGKTMLLEAVSVGRDFCKFMIGFATGAVPIYLSIISLFLPVEYKLSSSEKVWTGVPVLAFMIAALVFVMGYMPTTNEISLVVLESIERDRRQAIGRRKWIGLVGFIIFLVGLGLASYAVLWVVAQ